MTGFIPPSSHTSQPRPLSLPLLQWNDFTVGEDFVCGIRNSGDTYCMGIDVDITTPSNSESIYSGESDSHYPQRHYRIYRAEEEERERID